MTSITSYPPTTTKEANSTIQNVKCKGNITKAIKECSQRHLSTQCCDLSLPSIQVGNRRKKKNTQDEDMRVQILKSFMSADPHKTNRCWATPTILPQNASLTDFLQVQDNRTIKTRNRQWNVSPMIRLHRTAK